VDRSGALGRADALRYDAKHDSAIVEAGGETARA
jgi:hypothetical protein